MLKLKENSVVVVRLGEIGVDGFRYLRERKIDQREMYFISEITPRPTNDETVLLGQFLFEFENCPKEALPLTLGGTNRIYFPSDHRVDSFEEPTEEEKKEFLIRMSGLADRQPKYAQLVENILRSMINLVS